MWRFLFLNFPYRPTLHVIYTRCITFSGWTSLSEEWKCRVRTCCYVVDNVTPYTDDWSPPTSATWGLQRTRMKNWISTF